MKESISAVAFDIDGTLYPEWRLNCRILPYVLRNLNFFIKFARVRKILHRTAPLPDFYEYQGRLLAELMKIPPEQAKALIYEKIYQGLTPYFLRLKPYPYIREILTALREAGIKTAVFSDFPPEQKGDIWGCAPLCDVVLGSESCGALKPSKYSFIQLAQKLNVPPERILYVGNSLHSDIHGAQSAGMRTAYILPLWRRLLRRDYPGADISFSNYRQLLKIVLY